jgi:DHA1 family bicyclomycin/chloramphenicol resistance-like MFS transporter
VALIAALMAASALAIDTMLPALPAIAESLGILSGNNRQWVVTSYLLGFGIAQLFFGSLSDRFGRKPVILFGLSGYIASGLGAAAAPTFAMLLLCRVLQGMAMAAVRVVIVSVVRDRYAGARMARVMSLAFMAFLIAPVLAPALGQLVLTVASWRGLFALLAVYGLVMLGWTMARLDETLVPELRRPMKPSLIMEALRIVIRKRSSMMYMLAATALGGTLYGFITSVEQVFAETFGMAQKMPAAFAIVAGSMACGSLLNARIVERFGSHLLSMIAVSIFSIVEAGHLVIVLAGSETVWTLCAAQALAMFCFSLSVSNLSAMAMEPLARVAGMAASVQGFVTTVGGALIGCAIGLSFDGTTLPMTIGFLATGLTAWICLWCANDRKAAGYPLEEYAGHV